MKIRFLFVLLIFISATINSQNQEDNSIQLFSSGLHFIPFKANIQEARLGVLYYPSNTNLKVDIGNNVDLIKMNFAETKSIITLSVEFMGYALSTSYSGKRLQIDALDGFFGGNIAYSKNFEKGRLISRFRIIHNSAHLVDGHYDREAGKWLNDDEPIPYTRDFGDFTLGYQFYPSFGSLRTYGTISYSSLVRPAHLKRWGTYFGYELAFSNLISKIYGEPTNIFIASQFNLIGAPEYKLNSNFMSGLKIGEWDGKGLVIYLSYYIGSNPFSEYYSQRVRQFGIGFFVDFF